MCGIVGILSKRKNGIFHSDMDLFSELLFANQLRGAHGTGIFYDVKSTRVDAFKGHMPSSAFLRCEEVKPIFNDIVQKSSFVIGHNRHATKGKINFENTHPFIEGPVTLIHNGTLPYHKDLKDVEVDSHAICHSMSDIGYIETLKKIDGAFALVWFDQRDGKLRFIRNSDRPLYILESSMLFIISSEAKMADWIMTRKSEAQIKDPVMCTVGQLYTYDPKTGQLTDEKVDIKPKTSYLPAAHYYGGKWNVPQKHEEPVKDFTNIPYIDVKVGDEVIFSPIDVNPHGKTFLLQGLAETIIYPGGFPQRDLKTTEELTVKVYNESEQHLNLLLDHAICRATVIQIIWKNNAKTVVVKDVVAVDVFAPKDHVALVTVN